MMEGNEEDGEYQFRAEFQKIDKDRDGLISYQELMILMKKCGYPCTDAELQDYVNDVSINENGEIGEQAFLDIIVKCQEEADTQDELLELFKIFDKNNKSLLTPQNVFDIFRKIDENIKYEEILQMFKECDLDNDGVCNYQDFIDFWREVREN